MSELSVRLARDRGPVDLACPRLRLGAPDSVKDAVLNRRDGARGDCTHQPLPVLGGDLLYRIDPYSRETRVTDWARVSQCRLGVSAHPQRSDARTGELLVFTYGKQLPTSLWRVVERETRPGHYVDVALSIPRCSRTWRSTRELRYTQRLSIFPGTRMALNTTANTASAFPRSSRFSSIPRRGDSSRIQWFGRRSTYVLHFTNATPDGD